MPLPLMHRGGVATALAWTPEWPVTVLAATAWLALSAFGVAAADHAIHETTAGMGWWSAAAARAGTWALMCLAMMVPATLPAVRHVALNSIRARRQRAIAVYLSGYLAVWMMFGLLAAWLVQIATEAGASNRQLVLATLVLASGWQVTRAKWRAVIACRRTVPLPPEGWPADAACARFGVSQSWRCLVSCWPSMLLMIVVGHALALMIVLTILVVAEERHPRRDRVIVPLAGVFATASIWVALAR